MEDKNTLELRNKKNEYMRNWYRKKYGENYGKSKYNYRYNEKNNDASNLFLMTKTDHNRFHNDASRLIRSTL